MDTTKFYGLMEISRELGVPYWQIIYAEQAGHIAEPLRIACKRAYTTEDIARIKIYFLHDDQQEPKAKRQIKERPGTKEGKK